MNKYVDLVLTEDRNVYIAPAFTHCISAGSEVKVQGKIKPQKVIQKITVSVGTDDYKFIFGLIGVTKLKKVLSVTYYKTLDYDESEGETDA